jgi:hypothetical protein
MKPKAKQQRSAGFTGVLKVERNDVKSAPVKTLDFDSVAQWLKARGDVKGAIVRVRLRVLPGEVAPAPSQVRNAMLASGAVAAHVTIEPTPEARKERVEGISSIPSPKGRMRSYLASRFGPGIAMRDEVASEVWRIMEEVYR